MLLCTKYFVYMYLSVFQMSKIVMLKGLVKYHDAVMSCGLRHLLILHLIINCIQGNIINKDLLDMLVASRFVSLKRQNNWFIYLVAF